MDRLVDFQPKKQYVGGLKSRGGKHAYLINKLLKYIPPARQPIYVSLRSDGSTDVVRPHQDMYEEEDEPTDIQDDFD